MRVRMRRGWGWMIGGGDVWPCFGLVVEPQAGHMA